MRLVFGLACFGALSLSVASPRPRVLLIPVDDRPATGQFAQMIGDIASVEVVTPPADLLGRFTVPGRSDDILAWLESQSVGEFQAVVLSTDMLAYGGLIASRESTTTYEEAIRRLRRFQAWRRANPATPVYGFSSVMRLAPTALERTAPWRDALSKLVLAKSRYAVASQPELKAEIERLRTKVPGAEVANYMEARRRDHLVQRELCRQVASGVYDYFVFGQDDARSGGPQMGEIAKLGQMVANLKVTKKVEFGEGIDQNSNVLTCRAITRALNWSPRVRVVYSDNSQILQVPSYETRAIAETIQDQIEASGGTIAPPGESFDYSLFVNVPRTSSEAFELFKSRLCTEIDQGFPVALADTDLGADGIGDPELFRAMVESGRAKRLLAYAGWNTAGNTLGTAIPAASTYLAARQTDTNPGERELYQQRFLFHRLVNDFVYHQFTRPQAYKLREETEHGPRDEVYGYAFDVLNDFVRRDMTARIEDLFRSQFQGSTFFGGVHQFEVTKLSDLEIGLPWPRAYEIRIAFRLQASEVGVSGSNELGAGR